MDFGEALANSLLDVIAEVISIGINWVLRKLGYPETETKRIKRVVVWLLAVCFILLLFMLTIQNS